MTPPAKQKNREESPSISGQLIHGRERKSWSQQDVAEKLHLPKRIIEALEQENFNEHPGFTFMRGYLLSYSRLLDLDEHRIAALLAEQHPSDDFTQPLQLPTYRKRVSVVERSMPWLTVLIVLVLVILMVMWWHERRDSDDMNVPVLPATAVKTVTKPAVAPPAKAIAPVTKPSPAPTSAADKTADISSLSSTNYDKPTASSTATTPITTHVNPATAADTSHASTTTLGNQLQTSSATASSSSDNNKSTHHNNTQGLDIF
jgi:cytoskeleton protein RodZ